MTAGRPGGSCIGDLGDAAAAVILQGVGAVWIGDGGAAAEVVVGDGDGAKDAVIRGVPALGGGLVALVVEEGALAAVAIHDGAGVACQIVADGGGGPGGIASGGHAAIAIKAELGAVAHGVNEGGKVAVGVVLVVQEDVVGVVAVIREQLDLAGEAVFVVVDEFGDAAQTVGALEEVVVGVVLEGGDFAVVVSLADFAAVGVVGRAGDGPGLIRDLGDLAEGVVLQQLRAAIGISDLGRTAAGAAGGVIIGRDVPLEVGGGDEAALEVIDEVAVVPGGIGDAGEIACGIVRGGFAALEGAGGIAALEGGDLVQRVVGVGSHGAERVGLGEFVATGVVAEGGAVATRVGDGGFLVGIGGVGILVAGDAALGLAFLQEIPPGVIDEGGDVSTGIGAGAGEVRGVEALLDAVTLGINNGDDAAIGAVFRALGAATQGINDILQVMRRRGAVGELGDVGQAVGDADEIAGGIVSIADGAPVGVTDLGDAALGIADELDGDAAGVGDAIAGEGELVAGGIDGFFEPVGLRVGEAGAIRPGDDELIRIPAEAEHEEPRGAIAADGEEALIALRHGELFIHAGIRHELGAIDRAEERTRRELRLEGKADAPTLRRSDINAGALAVGIGREKAAHAGGGLADVAILHAELPACHNCG